MNQQGAKYHEGLHLLASQTSSLLTNKQVDQMESIVEKCIFTLSECEKSSFIKFLASFFKLFLHCPSNYSEVFYKKSQSILKDGFQSKSKSIMQEKYEALTVALFETAEKYFSPLFSQALKSNTGTHQELIENIMNLNIKGGLNLKGFIGLLRKFIQKDHENNKIGEALGALKDIFNKTLQQILEDIKKGNKIQENISFKLFFFNCLYEQLTSKYDSQAIVFLKDIYKQQISKTQDQQASKAMFLMQFLLLNQNNSSIVEMISEHSSNTSQSYSLQPINKNNYLMDLLSSLLLFLGLNHQLTQNNRNFLNGFLLLQKRRYKSLSLKLKSSINHQTTVNALFTSQRSTFLEQFILELLVKIKIHLGQSQYSKVSVISLLKNIVCVNSHLSECLPIQETKFPQILETNLFKSIQENRWITPKAKIFLTLLYCFIFTNHFNDYSCKLVIQTRLFNVFREIVQNNKKELSHQQHFFSELYTFMNFKASKSDYLQAIFGSQKEKESVSIIKDIHQFFLNQAASSMVQQKNIGAFIDQNTERLEKNKFTFQNILDLLITMLQQEQSIEANEQSEQNCPFNQLSLILFDKINIRPKKINKIQEQISFLKEKLKSKPQLCITFCTKMYQYDSLLKSNLFFMKSVPQNELNTQKIIVNALRKYFGMYYNRINELVIRKWIINREYLTIWSLLLCNYKVKTIGQQLLKCGISVEEMRGFFKIQAQVLKDFLEYLMTKDKYKFKLALFNCGLQHRRQLIDYSLPQLLL